MFDITPIVEAVFALVLAVIAVFVIPYIRSKTTLSQQAEIQSLVTIAVTAAEQIFRGTGLGEKKKAYVLQWLQDHGVTVNMDKLDAMIESAVHELNANTPLLLGEAVCTGTDE